MENNEYFELDLPEYLISSINAMKDMWEKIDSGKPHMNWDLCWDELNADINCAETDEDISPEQAWYLREKYLRMSRREF